jgi:hypothetical protein
MRVAAVVRAALAPESLAAAREWHRVDCNCLVETDMGEWGALCLVGRRLAALDATVRKENKE